MLCSAIMNMYQRSQEQQISLCMYAYMYACISWSIMNMYQGSQEQQISLCIYAYMYACISWCFARHLSCNSDHVSKEPGTIVYSLCMYICIYMYACISWCFGLQFRASQVQQYLVCICICIHSQSLKYQAFIHELSYDWHTQPVGVLLSLGWPIYIYIYIYICIYT